MLIMKKTVGKNQVFFLFIYETYNLQETEMFGCKQKKNFVPGDFFKFSIKAGVNDNELNILCNLA